MEVVVLFIRKVWGAGGVGCRQSILDFFFGFLGVLLDFLAKFFDMWRMWVLVLLGKVWESKGSRI